MSTFVKLYGSIIHSSIWAAPDHVRLVWITMLAMADMNGEIEASVVGISGASRLSVDQTKDAIRILSGPDPDSKDGTTGERIEKIDRGWRIINHGYYRDLRSHQQVRNAQRQAEFRARRQGVTSNKVTPCNGDTVYVYASKSSGSLERRESERGETPKPKRTKAAVERPEEVSEEHWRDWLSARSSKKAGPVTATALKLLVSEASKAGWSLDAAVGQAAARGWASFKADWVAGQAAPEVFKSARQQGEEKATAEREEAERLKREAEDDLEYLKQRRIQEADEAAWESLGRPHGTYFLWRRAGRPGLKKEN